ncbi:alpha/beta hydrolase [Candidatus Protochlamydia sp. R18]|uniref:alpha/beta hydrolase n=1 Tax=Candidatus Protochlamydia sp. R18 TaxID=1353977 RepID=UPI0005A85686|nr:alpha/beta hydrolase [Candidatus Protochlamydia sp. R18]
MLNPVFVSRSYFCLDKTFSGKTGLGYLGRTIIWIKDKLKSVAIDALAYALFFVAARTVIFSSTHSFKKKCSAARVENSRLILQSLGGKELSLKMPDGHQISAMYLNSSACLEVLINKGAQKDNLQLTQEQVQEILWIPQDKQDLLHLVDRLNLTLKQHNGRDYVALGIPKNSSQIDSTHVISELNKANAGTVIYAPGSGHIFEFRRKTIGTFLVGYGMNMLVFNYSQTGRSEGKISEQASYENVEAAYEYLKKVKKLSNHKILGYGHCMGAGPILHLASKHSIPTLVDRAPINMGTFAQLRLITLCKLPSFFYFLTDWVKPVMENCFRYANDERIAHVKGCLALIEATHDAMIPAEYIQNLFDLAKSAKSKVKLTLESDHDADLCGNDELLRLDLGKFLTEAQIIGY